MYKIPDDFYFRLHHARPRFKNDIESVLLYFANSCSRLGELPIKEYMKKLNQEIMLYPGNDDKAEKTINNWRTEIAALFGFYIDNKESGKTSTGEMAYFLDKEQDLVQFFKFYLFKFQYPGGHLKSDKVKEMIDQGIKFKPANYILSVLQEAEKTMGKPLGITKAEATHCIFNDLRVTRDNRKPSEVVQLILANRSSHVEYDSTGDVIRYAGDILDYMVHANLLYESHGYFYINRTEMESIMVFLSDFEFFSGYDEFYSKGCEVSEISEHEAEWFSYVNSNLSASLFQTDLTTYLSDDETVDEDSKFSISVDEKIAEILDESGSTKDIGDLGETLVIGHEKVRLLNLGRSDLIHLIKKIPTQLAVGYDIQSVEEDQRKRYIEVKTTVSYRPLKFFSFHMTPNEWDTAQTLKDRYFVYRLMINKMEKTIYILQDPVMLYKNDQISMSPRNGVEISFKEDVSEKTELLLWKN